MLESVQEEDARETLPLCVGLEELAGVRWVGPASVQGGLELHEPEIADQTRVVAAEPLEGHDADAPWPDPTRSLEALQSRVAVGPQPLEVERAAETRERRGAARSEAAAGELCRRQPSQRLARRWLLPARANDRSLDLERAAGLNQLAAHGPERRMGNGGLPARAHTSEAPRRRAE